MSDTPRTDRRVIRQDPKMCGCCYKSEITYASHARQLERELAEVTKQRDAAIEGLEKLASLDFVITLPDRMDAVRKIANETLNKLKP